jgi:hypothetical protein
MLAGCASPGQTGATRSAIRVEPTPAPITFTWSSARIGDRIEPHHAILIPVRLNAIEKTFYMQFDLGAQSTLFYRAKIDSIRERYPEVSYSSQGESLILAPLRLSAGETNVSSDGSRVIELKSAQPVNWSPDAIDVIGTFGADLIADRIMIVDYPGKAIRLVDALPAEIASKVALVPMSFQSRRIFLDGKINGDARKIIYDTGSSAFEMLTDESTWKKLARAGAPVETYDVKSWNDTLTTHSVATDATIEIGGVVLPLKRVTRVEGVGVLTQLAMRTMGVGGMTGNKLFIDHTIVLDTKNQRFGVVK